MNVGDVFKIDYGIFLVLDYEYFDGVYKVRYKNLKFGSERTEMFEEAMANHVEKINLVYEKETKYHYVFKTDDIVYEFVKENVDDVIESMKTGIFPNQKSSPVLTDVFPNNIISGTKVSFYSENADEIYYSVNGSKFVFYEKEIEINEDCKITLFSKKEGLDDSEKVSFDFKVRNKTPKIYFSPSRQVNNKGINPEIYPDEMYMMNKLTDKIIDNLKDYQVVCYRNEPELFMKDWIDEGKKKEIDLHFALHSNGTSSHDKKGVETWIDYPISKTHSLAKMIHSSIYELYYDNNNPMTNRGVKFARGGLMECNDNVLDFGILLEVAYHDNLEDSKWIANNMDEIAKTLSKTLINYFQLKNLR